MENFVLYEELGKGLYSVIYKGRKKGTIDFVAIHCIEKHKRCEVTNTVRMIHDINHPNVVKFEEWYETTNHLWMVVELCTGGSLEKLIALDGHLPENSIKTFGIDMLTGLHFLHSLSILFCDLKPSTILLDGSGTMKFADFGLAKAEGENLEEIFQTFAELSEIGNAADKTLMKQQPTKGSPNYLAPEVLQDDEATVLSDLWSLGCVLYEMFTGHPPFLADDFEQLVHKVCHQELPFPKVRGTRFSSKASPDFLSLLQGLLQKDPAKRLGWHELVTHPFWEKKLEHLTQEMTIPHDTLMDEKTTMTSTIKSSVSDYNSSVLNLPELKCSEQLVSVLDQTDGGRSGSAMGDHLRPKTAPVGDTGQGLFTLSTRPFSVVPPDDKVTYPEKAFLSPRCTTGLRFGGVGTKLQNNIETEMLELIYHPSDFIMSPIIDNPKIFKPQPLKYDLKTIPIPPYTAEKILSLSEKEMARHLKVLIDHVGNVEKGPPSQKRLHFLNYVGTLASNSAVATNLVKIGILPILAKQAKDVQHLDMRLKLGRVTGLLVNNVLDLDESVNLSEPMMMFTELLRDNLKNSKMRQGMLPAVGELLHLVAIQEQLRNTSVECWSVPSMTYTIIARCCREGDDTILNHTAAKIIENVTATAGHHAQKFVSNEIGQSLWYLYKHSTADSLRITALSALCRITRHSVSVFQSIVDSVGLSSLQEALCLGISRIHQAMVTMFAALIAAGGSLHRLLQDKGFLPKVIHLLDSPSTVIRGKAFILIQELTKNSHKVLLSFCQSRLVMYIERDSRQQIRSMGDSSENSDYLMTCLNKLGDTLIETIPKIAKEVLASLEPVMGRQHPSSAHIKQLRSTLPLVAIFQHLITSTIFRPRVITEKFMKDLGMLMVHVKNIEIRETNIETAIGPTGSAEFISSVIGTVESVTQHPQLLLEHQMVVMQTIFPTLAELTANQNADTRASSLWLVTEISSIYLSQEQCNLEEQHLVSKSICDVIDRLILPQCEQILFDQDPLPSYGLKLLLVILEQTPSFIRQLEKLALLPDHQNKPLSSAVQSIVDILTCIVGQKDTNMKELYELGLMDHLLGLLTDVGYICFEREVTGHHKVAGDMLVSLLNTLHGVLKYVSDVVRKALQVRKLGNDSAAASREAEEAEQLLLTNKPVTDITSLLTQLLCYNDSDVQEWSTKCLSLVIQLFGGEHKEALSQENMNFYSKALQSADNKTQKALLRVIKRLVSSDKVHADSFRQNGEVLTITIRSLSQTASSKADVGLSSLATEILKMRENKG